MNLVIENPEIIKIPSIEIQCHNLEGTKLTNEINRELDKTECDEEYVKILIMAQAATQYGLCSDGLLPQKARKIKAAFEQSEPAEKFDAELFYYSVDKVLIRQDGAVFLTLKNGQRFEHTERR